MDRHQEHWLKPPEWEKKEVKTKKKRNPDFIVFGLWSLIITGVLLLLTICSPIDSPIRTIGMIATFGNLLMGFITLCIGIG